MNAPTYYNVSLIYRKFVIFGLSLTLWLSHFSQAMPPEGASEFPQAGPLFGFLVQNGRALGVILLAIMTILFGVLAIGVRRQRLPRTVGYVVFLGVLILIKTAYFGDTAFAFFAIPTLIAAALTFGAALPSINFINNKAQNYQTVLTIIYIVAVLITYTNLVIYIVYPESAVNYSGRLHGASANPQHLVMTLCLVMPAVLYNLYPETEYGSVRRFSAFVTAIVIIYLCFLTNSRIGLFCCILISIPTVVRYLYLINRFLLSGVLVLACSVVVIFLVEIWSDFIARFVEDREETRSVIWMDAWEVFQSNALIGAAPSAETGRLNFIENFWLSAIANMGLIGFVLAILILISMIILIRETAKLAIKKDKIALSALTGLITITLLSIGESVMFGVFTSYTCLCFVYLGLSRNIVSNIKKL